MKIISPILLIVMVTSAFAQNRDKIESGSYLGMSWKHVATRMPSEWYGSDEAKLAAENVLLTQKDIGGWEKNKNYHQLPKAEIASFIKEKSEAGATFDNGATIKELRFLANVYAHFKDERYKQAFEKGLDYIFLSQYDNGGWPQFYPARKDVPYSSHITYNDDAMVNVMLFLRDIYSNDECFTSFKLTKKVKAKAKKAFDNGIKCILNTQIIVDNKPTVWCAQHDEKTLAPANARSYELASFSGSESVGITLLLMSIDNPSKDITKAINGAVEWFKIHKLEGIRLEKKRNKEGKKDLVVIHDKDASPLWARFYDLETAKPYFCSRNGIQRESLDEISYERRNGYSWYTNAPEKLIKKYLIWKAKTVE